MKLDSLYKLYVEQLKDLYSAETQLVEALPKMAKAASSTELRQAFQEHLAQTKEHVSRLEQIFKGLEYKPTGQKCKGMAGLIEEGEEMIEEDADDDVRDAGLIAAAQRVEHYEISGYGTVRTYAHMLDRAEDASILQQTLDEESETDEKLSMLAESSINVKAQQTQ
ncbi:MAG: ferritin-like domain-containing protein [Caldilineaceae bacterium]|nr:ferritin-like domain-containing protein [Caldilineaceae bacterium]